MDAHSSPLRSKSSLTGLWFLVFCALALAVSQRFELGLCADARHATLRELVRDERDAEVVFVGSSQTARGVIPALFDQRATELLGRDVRSVNLATFGNARHISYLTLERWLAHHGAPRVVYVECGVLSDVPEFPHKTLTRFGEPRDALALAWERPYAFLDGKEFVRIEKSGAGFDVGGIFRAWSVAQLNADLALDVLGRGSEDCVRTLANLALERGESPYWMPGEPQMRAEIARQVEERGYFRIELDSAEGIEARRSVEKQAALVSYEKALAAEWKGPDEFANPARFRVTRLYAEKLARLCRAHGIRLVFLDQPNFRGRPLRPAQVEFYRSLGDLFVQDKSVLYRSESFLDSGHLSVAGAEFASRALASHFASLK
ncbi:MAG: hypothetical protein FJ298_02165 [Planctomycetes bacterium]|nr:hypothetical protein [Planctomycetota bacterium]